MTTGFYTDYKSVNTGSVTQGELKSFPKPLVVSSYGQAITPAVTVVQERPHYVIVTGQSATAYQFLYETTCSIGSTCNSTTEKYIQGLDLQAISNAPIRLDIQPVAWRRTDSPAYLTPSGSFGEVTFVYKGK